MNYVIFGNSEADAITDLSANATLNWESGRSDGGQTTMNPWQAEQSGAVPNSVLGINRGLSPFPG
ncbi:hypothetical protein [Halioglobus sp. HI00S01]|uniref:hypothetical protein n=1 Tax=Halioglobus sp. HI00S01 TaxID=1822214 RepID=UPI0012E8246D|nr:hypothetical protein [Halioglobus sp. HI00S01]